MPSSSSSEEDLSKFREATDSTFHNDSLYQGKQAKMEEKPLIIAPPSLRYIEEEEDRIHNELKVTPSFQKHVAKHLSKLLDRQLELKDKSAENCNQPNESRNVLKAKRGKNLSSADTNSSGGVRLLGASAVFLSNLNIVPSNDHRRKRGRKFACFSSGSESSSEEIDSDTDISQNRVLSGNASKGFKITKPLLSDPSKDELSRGYESLNEIGSNSNHLSIEALSLGAKDDMAFLSLHKKKKKAAHLESELAASVSSMLSLGSDSQGDVPIKIKKKKMKKKKKRRKEQYSEDATTETTEVEDIVEERRKKVKSKRRRREEKKAEEMAIIRECVPGLIEETEENEKFKECKKKKKKKKRNKVKGEESYLKKQKCRFKLSKSSKTISKKKMSKNVSRLSEDLAKLMMNPNEAS